MGNPLNPIPGPIYDAMPSGMQAAASPGMSAAKAVLGAQMTQKMADPLGLSKSGSQQTVGLSAAEKQQQQGYGAPKLI